MINIIYIWWPCYPIQILVVKNQTCPSADGIWIFIDTLLFRNWKKILRITCIYTSLDLRLLLKIKCYRLFEIFPNARVKSVDNNFRRTELIFYFETIAAQKLINFKYYPI